MSESGELYTTVNYIKHKVDTLEKIELLNLRSNKELSNEYITLFTVDSILFDVYKAIDGIKAQKEIAPIVGMTEMTVSNKIKILMEYGLIENIFFVIMNPITPSQLYKTSKEKS